MKAVITGASSDVGKIIIEHFDYKWICIDRTHGITLPQDVDKFTEAIQESSLFFNLANFNTIQSELLPLAWNTWNDMKPSCPHKVISFGSLVTEIDMQTILQMSNWEYFNRERLKNNYIAEKLLLSNVHKTYKDLHLKGLSNNYCMPQSILIKLGNILLKENRSKEPYTSKDQLLEVVDYAINSKSYISDLEVRWN